MTLNRLTIMKIFTVLALSLLTFTSDVSRIYAFDMNTSPTSAEALLDKANEALNEGYHEQAMLLYKKVRKISKPHAEKAHLGIIASYIEARQFKEARVALSTFERLYPETEYFASIADFKEILKKQEEGWLNTSTVLKVIGTVVVAKITIDLLSIMMMR